MDNLDEIFRPLDEALAQTRAIVDECATIAAQIQQELDKITADCEPPVITEL